MREAQLEADQSPLELFPRDCLAPIVVDEVEAGLDGHRVPPQVFSDLLEHSPLPLDGVECALGVKRLLLAFKCLVQLEVVELIRGLVEPKDLAERSLVLLRE